ncbi:MAG: ParM/StbA family protein [Peptococcaceae bacterium]|nr:ParM/StbA family protein [Peptococcaceae bacterium]
MQIAIDVGYSHTKAVTTDKRVLIPSVVAPYRELALADLRGNDTGHIVTIRRVDGTTSRHFVGELAVQEGRGATFTLDRDKHRHPNHDVLILTAARLLGAGPGAILVAGLPVAYYASQKEDLRRHLEALHAEVSVDGSMPSRVSFGRVIVYPQGAGAMLAAPDLPDSGLVLLVDVGYKTTDYVTAEIVGGMARPVSSLCGSVEIGIFAVHEALAAGYQAATGAPLPAVRIPEIMANGGKTYHYGRELDLSDVLGKARADTARAIADQVRAAMGDRMAAVRKVLLAGGGAEELPLLRKLLLDASVVDIIPEPLWANASGFLKLIGG